MVFFGGGQGRRGRWLSVSGLATLALVGLSSSCGLGVFGAEDGGAVGGGGDKGGEMGGEMDREEMAKRMAAARAQHPLTDLPEAAPGVETTFWFPEAGEDGELEVGSIGEVLLGFRNSGKAALNVSYVMGSLNAPDNFGVFLQNFTARGYHKVVWPHEEATFSFRFRPFVEEEYRLQMALTVFYLNEGGNTMYSSTFFNDTVAFVDSPVLIKGQTLQLLAMILGSLVTFGVVAYKSIPEKAMIKARRRAERIAGTRGVPGGAGPSADGPGGAASKDVSAEWVSAIQKTMATNKSKKSKKSKKR